MAQKKFKYVDRLGEFKELLPSDKITPKQLREIILDSTEIKLTKTKKGKRGVAVFDRITGKRLSITKFKKYTGIDKPIISYLKTKDFEEKFTKLPSNARVNEFVETIMNVGNYNLSVSSEHADSFIKGYKTYWNLEGPLSTSEFNERMNELHFTLEERPYLIKLHFQYSGEEIYIREEGHIADWISDYVKSDKSEKSYTDPNNNFVLMSS